MKCALFLLAALFSGCNNPTTLDDITTSPRFIALRGPLEIVSRRTSSPYELHGSGQTALTFGSFKIDGNQVDIIRFYFKDPWGAEGSIRYLVFPLDRTEILPDSSATIPTLTVRLPLEFFACYESGPAIVFRSVGCLDCAGELAFLLNSNASQYIKERAVGIAIRIKPELIPSTVDLSLPD